MASSTESLPKRNLAIDAYRGFVMLLMMGEVLHFSKLALAHPTNWLLKILAYNQTHVEWAGMSLHDTIQPGFTFLVGVALPYSLRSRMKRQQPFQSMFLHTIWRSLVLVFLGIFLRSTHSAVTNFTFEDTLTQIGLGYSFAFLLAFVHPRWQWTSLGLILFGYWLAWAVYPAPGVNFSYPAVGVPTDWSHLYHGFSSHWNKNSNFGQAFDLWFLNLFPRPEPFRFNGGGYLTLSFIPTLGTMIIGLITGQWLIQSEPEIPFRRMLTTAAALMAVGIVLHVTGICPIVKRIWTPSWTLFSGGVCILFLVLFCWGVYTRKHSRAAFPFVVVGMNAISAYLMVHLMEEFLQHSFRTHISARVLNGFGAYAEPTVVGILTLTTYWLMLFWMYRRKIFLRI